MKTSSFDFLTYESFKDFTLKTGLSDTEALLIILEKIEQYENKKKGNVNGNTRDCS